MALLAFEDITVTRAEADFDRACDEGYRAALMRFQIDEDGHSPLPDWERSDSWIELRFVEYVRIGSQHVYRFVASANKNDDSEMQF